MARLYPKEVDIHTLSPLNLAFVGDCVYELLVRERLVCEANRPNHTQHTLSVALVRAEAQAEAAERIMPLLTEHEAAVFRRGRNAHTTRAGEDYHAATGLETLYGYLYLSEQIDRLRLLFTVGLGDANGDAQGN